MIRSPASRMILLFAAASIAAVLAGAPIMAGAGLGSGWTRNCAAWLIGAIMAGVLLASGRRPGVVAALPLLAVIALAATLLAAPVDGVHRWVDAGPLHVNLAAFLLPPAVVALSLRRTGSRLSMGVAALIALLLILQPDASQASAFAVAIAVVILRSGLEARVSYAALLFPVAAAVAAWLRPDAVQPVPEVEQIFSIGWTVSAPLALLGALALAAASLSPLVARTRDESARTAALALTGYFAIAALAPFFGAFPVPLVGLGMSFPVGYWLAIGLLSANLRTRP